MSNNRKEALEALEALRDKVKAGSAEGFSGNSDFFRGLCISDQASDAYDAYYGSLDAAKALHDAVLPGWGCVVNTYRQWARVWGQDDDDCPTHEAVSMENTARAWLIAILEALIAEEGE